MDKSELKINLKSLKRVDPYIESIDDSATQVALYKYADNEWEKLDIEGTLFVTSRQDDPKFGFIILNRLSDKNLLEPVTKELDFQLQTPFLLYKNKEGNIFGIWFYEPKECERICERVRNCVKITEQRYAERESESKKEEDIMTLLHRAKKQNNQNHGKKSQDGDQLLRLFANSQQKAESPVQKTPVSASNGSVADFFAKASESGSAFSTPMMSTSASMKMTGELHATAAAAAAVGPVGPVFSPQISTLHPIIGPLRMPMMPGEAPGIFRPPTHPLHVPVAIPAAVAPTMRPQEPGSYYQGKPQSPANPVLQKLLSNPGTYSAESLERSQREGSPLVNATGSPMLPPLPADACIARELESDFKNSLTMNTAVEQSKSATATTASSKQPELMSPMVFSQPPPSSSSSQKLKQINGNGVSVPPLNKQQMIQALQHLLTTDPIFVTKLHQAYVDSLNTKLQ